MPQQTQYDAQKCMVVLTYSGKVTMPEVREATAQALAIQQEKRTTRVLIDTRAMTAWPTLGEMWQLVQSYPQMDVPRRTRLAVLRPEVPDETNLSGFYETVCQNRSYNAKVFPTREAAEQWLQSDGGSGSGG